MISWRAWRLCGKYTGFRMTQNELAKETVNAAYRTRTLLDPGRLETAYGFSLGVGTRTARAAPGTAARGVVDQFQRRAHPRGYPTDREWIAGLHLTQRRQAQRIAFARSPCLVPATPG